VIAKAAAAAKVATQMGTQMHASPNFQRVVELVQTGAIGPVREAHVWVSRAWGWQTPEEAKANKDIVAVTERPEGSTPVPKGVHWELFLGPAPERPFHEVYWPGPRWYRWWDFGSGTMSDMGSHLNDLPFWALKLRDPVTIEAEGPPPHAEIAPASMLARYTYGARGEMPPVTVTWHQGKKEAGNSQENPAVGIWRSCSWATRMLPRITRSMCCCRREVRRLNDRSHSSRGTSRNGSRLQDRRAHRLELRLRVPADHRQPSRQRGLPARQEDPGDPVKLLCGGRMQSRGGGSPVPQDGPPRLEAGMRIRGAEALLAC
jgi:hypothetical protein